MHRYSKFLILIVVTLTIASIVFAARPVLANVDLIFFRATSGTDMIILEWETATELDNLGFNILRSESSSLTSAQAINPSLIPSLVGGQPIGATYEWQDEDVELNTTYHYWLQDVDFDGGVRNHGPAQASLAGSSAIPTAPPANTAQPTLTATPTTRAASTETASPTQVVGPTATQRQIGTTPTSSFQPTFTPAATTAATTSDLATSTLPSANTEETTIIDGSGIEPSTTAAEGGPDSTSTENLETVLTAPPEEIGSNLQPAPSVPSQSPQSIAGASNANQEAQVLGGANSGQSSADDAESGGRSAVSKTTLALMILAAAILLIVSAAIALWVILNPRTTSSPDE